MKRKLLILIVAAMSGMSLYGEGLGIKAGLFLKAEMPDFEELDNGFNLQLSYDFAVKDAWDLGLGAEFGTKFDDGNNELAVYPVFGEIKYNFDRKEKVNPYLIAKLGYPILSQWGDTAKGAESMVYFGAGAGVDYGNFSFELLVDGLSVKEDLEYTSNAGTYWEKTEVSSTDNMLTRVSFTIGYTMREYKKKVEDSSESYKTKVKLNSLENLKESGVISEEEYLEKREEILSEI